MAESCTLEQPVGLEPEHFAPEEPQIAPVEGIQFLPLEFVQEMKTTMMEREGRRIFKWGGAFVARHSDTFYPIACNGLVGGLVLLGLCGSVVTAAVSLLAFHGPAALASSLVALVFLSVCLLLNAAGMWRDVRWEVYVRWDRHPIPPSVRQAVSDARDVLPLETKFVVEIFQQDPWVRAELPDGSVCYIAGWYGSEVYLPSLFYS